MAKASERTVGHFLVLAARLHRLRASQLLSEIGLFPGQDAVLQLLGEHKEMAMGDLAAALHVRPPTASKTVARLSAQGLVERASGTGDGRVVRVTLTNAGRALSAEIANLSEKLEEELTDHLDGKDRKRLRKSLRKLASMLGKRTGSLNDMEDEPEGDREELEAVGSP